jgi:hypothetical protein
MIERSFRQNELSKVYQRVDSAQGKIKKEDDSDRKLSSNIRSFFLASLANTDVPGCRKPGISYKLSSAMATKKH